MKLAPRFDQKRKSNSSSDATGNNMPCAKEKRQYQKHLRSFMSWQDDTEYTNTKEFSRDELLSVRPEDIIGYLTKMAYGKDELEEED